MREAALSIAVVALLTSAAPSPAQPGCQEGETEIIAQLPDDFDAFPSDSQCDFCGQGQRSNAENFDVTAAVAIERILIWGMYFVGNMPVETDDFRVLIHVDSLGEVGAAVSDQADVVPVSRTATGNTVGGDWDVYEYVLEIDSVELVAGRYWLEIFANTTSSTEEFRWVSSGTDTVPRWATAFEAPGATWSLNGPGGTGQNLSIVACGAARIFSDGFESGDTAAWFSAPR